MKVVIDINALPCKNGKDCTECAFYSVESICEIPTALQSFPKYEEERPHGEWLEKHCDYGVYYRCSNCHKMPPNYECDYKEGAIKTNFCPNCGADMREGEAE